MRVLNTKFPWYIKNGIHVTGYIRHGNQYVENEMLADYFAAADSLHGFEELLKSSNGQFSVIIITGEEIWAATDRVRHYPLFFTNIDGQYFIGDNCYDLLDLNSDGEFNCDAYNCFLGAGYVINDHTLINNIFQIEAGSYVVLGRSSSIRFYHHSRTEFIEEKNIESGTEEFLTLLNETFRDHFTALKDKFIAIPLSGGFDSRLVASMAKRYHPENILCYTYGSEVNREIPIAREIASRLGIKWIKIVYDSGRIKNFLTDEIFSGYYPYVSNLSGMFFMQEYFAVKYLKENNIIPENTIFMSGYSGDFIAGSYITPVMESELEKEKICRLICNNYFRLVNINNDTKARIIRLIGDRIPNGKSVAWKVIEEWDMKERHAKFIINSAQVFKYFGYDYVFPLWDNMLVDYMLNLPFSLRFNRRLYENTLTSRVFKVNNLNLNFETNPLPVQKSLQRFKEMVKPMIPGKIKNRFFDLRSHILYDEITELMREDMNPEMIISPRQPNYYNSYIVQWYLNETRELLMGRCH